MKTIYQLLVVGILCLFSTNIYAQFERVPEKIGEATDSYNYNCTCVSQADMDRFNWVLQKRYNDRLNEWLREKEVALKLAMEDRLGVAPNHFATYEAAQIAFFKSFKGEGLVTQAITSAKRENNHAFSRSSFARKQGVIESATLETAKQLLSEGKTPEFGVLKTKDGRLIKDMNLWALQGRIDQLKTFEDGNKNISIQNTKIADGLTKLEGNKAIMESFIVNEYLNHYKSFGHLDRVRLMVKYLIWQNWATGTSGVHAFPFSQDHFPPAVLELDEDNYIHRANNLANNMGTASSVPNYTANTGDTAVFYHALINHMGGDNLGEYQQGGIYNYMVGTQSGKGDLRNVTHNYFKAHQYSAESLDLFEDIGNSFLDRGVDFPFDKYNFKVGSNPTAQIAFHDANNQTRAGTFTYVSTKETHKYNGIDSILDKLVPSVSTQNVDEYLGGFYLDIFKDNGYNLSGLIPLEKAHHFFKFSPSNSSSIAFFNININFVHEYGLRLAGHGVYFPQYFQGDDLTKEAIHNYFNVGYGEFLNIKKLRDLKLNLSLEDEQVDWLRENTDEISGATTYLNQNNSSDWSKIETKLNIASKATASEWQSATGTINGNESFRYNATRNWTYPDGQIVKEFRLNNGGSIARGNYANSFYSSNSSDVTWFRPNGSQEWFQAVIDLPTSTSAQPFDFVIDKFWDGAKWTGRYAVPLEDVIVLLGGKDFEGNYANRYAAGGFLLVELIPGGKILKPVVKVLKNVRIWKVVSNAGVQIAEAVYTRFNNAVVDGVIENIDNLFRSGDVAVDVLEEAAEKIIDISETKGRKLTWEEVKALFKRGNDFNKKAVVNDWYPYHEVHLKNGKRLDSFDPFAGEIISRKATDLKNIKFSTFENYLKELKNKYPSGMEINSPKYSEEFKQFGILKIEGQQILEIPDINNTFSDIQRYINFAKDNYDIIIRFKPE